MNSGHGAIGILGATSLVGGPLADRLMAAGRPVRAVSRSTPPPRGPLLSPLLSWHAPGAAEVVGVECWVSLCPLWALPAWLPWLGRAGCRRLVAVSSTSVAAKVTSPDRHERELAARLAKAESAVVAGASALGADCVLLRPTMVYDGCRDGNVAAIAAFIRRWRFFPLAGAGTGLRQPVHAADVAAACSAALDAPAAEPIYTLSGAAPLTFRELVARIFAWLDLPPRMPSVPAPIFRAALSATHAFGCGRGVSAGMVARMNADLSCGHAAAARDLGFRPRPFTLDAASGSPAEGGG